MPTTSTGVPYTLKESARAKHVRLTVSAREGLVVTIPCGMNPDTVASFLKQKEPWIERALAKLEPKRAEYKAVLAGQVPLVIELRALNETLSIRYEKTGAGAISARRIRGLDAVSVRGNVADKNACVCALQRFIKREAAGALTERVFELAEESGVNVRTVRVKRMRSRWGSCSRQKEISLSQNLLFLPADLVDHVIFHELAHTKHLDHSSRFHDVLAKFDANKENHVMQLRKADRYIPAWADIDAR